MKSGYGIIRSGYVTLMLQYGVIFYNIFMPEAMTEYQNIRICQFIDTIWHRGELMN